jgi:rod shape-determining protein MreC|tara:strand:+ start:811 stop:1653 length:843 start_codon:yes stop_codon:yes gene_type:complete
MPRKQSFQAKAFVSTLALLFVWWLIPVLLKGLATAAFFEFTAPTTVAISYLKDLQDFWGNKLHSKEELLKAGVVQARLNAAYELRNQSAQVWETEVRRLESLLNLPSLPEHRYEVARVIRRDTNAWWQQLVIRKGRVHGLEVGQAVVYVGGVVGRLSEVHAYTAVVELLTSPRFRVAAHLENDLRPLQFQGGDNPPFQSPRATLLNVPPDIRERNTNESAHRIVSSRLGGVFPDGLTLGYIDELERSQDGLFQSGKALVDDRLLSLREVAVLIPLNKESP